MEVHGAVCHCGWAIGHEKLVNETGRAIMASQGNVLTFPMFFSGLPRVSHATSSQRVATAS